MRSLTISPNPAPPGTRRSLVGAGFSPASGVTITVNGVAYTSKFYPEPDGTFDVGLPKLPVAEGTYTIRATVGGKTAASVDVVVAPGAPPPPPPPPAAFHSTIVDGEVLSGPLPVPWLVVMDVGTAHHIDFVVDATLLWPEKAAPWGGDLDPTTLTNGPHIFSVVAYDAANDVIARSLANVTVANAPVIVPPPPAAGQLVLCSAKASTKDNWRIGKPNHGDLALRFRKRGTGPITGVAWQQRHGTNYSLGDGGLYRASIQLCKADGTPTGTILGVCSNKRYNLNRAADAYFETWVLDSPTVAIADGALCAFVIENVHNDPARNYFSLNALYMFGDAVGPERQWAYSNLELALLSNVGSGWGVSNETPNFDVLPNHEGFGYTQCNIEMFKHISGAAQVRQLLNLSAPYAFDTIEMRVRRASGSSPLQFIVETGAGAQLATASVPSSRIAQSAAGGDNGGQVLASATLPAIVTIPAGVAYLRALTAAGTDYTAAPVRRAVRDNVKGEPSWGSFMAPGIGQFTTGGAWASVYTSVEPQEDWQFALRRTLQ